MAVLTFVYMITTIVIAALAAMLVGGEPRQTTVVINGV